MNPLNDDHWVPPPQLLAAYGDGELDRRPDLVPLRRRIEQWLSSHPEAAAELESQRQLSRLVEQTRPRELPARVWAALWWRIVQSGLAGAKRASPARWVARLAGAAAAAAVFFIVTAQWVDWSPGTTFNHLSTDTQRSQVVDQRAPVLTQASLPVAVKGETREKGLGIVELLKANEMEILFVAGMDKSTFPIGWQPLNDPNEFLLSQEVQFSPPQGAEPRTELRICGGAKTPVLWTPSPRECKDAGDKKKNRRPPCH